MYKSPEELASTIALLASVPLFRACTVSELERLAATAAPIAFDPSDVLCEQGAESPECYVVAEGEVVVERDGALLGTIGPQDIVGERGPIDRRPRAATVIAKTRVMTYAISSDELEHLLDWSPVAAKAMRTQLVRRYG